MKATARQQHGNPVRTAKAHDARGQAKRRPGAGNRHRADAHERQAEELARRFGRGDTGLGARITPLPAAGIRIAGSSGRPLPATLREIFEAAFGADFHEVRVHTGTAANSVARDEHADAFTSGRDVFFRAGRFAPDSGEGRELLAHELTHVLQQTGRRNLRDELAATAATGAGRIQHTIEQDFKDRGLFEDTPDLDTVIARHTAEDPADTDLAAHVTTIKDTLGAGSVTPTPGEQLVAVTKDPGFTATKEQLALYFDALKQRGEYDLARKLVKYVLPPRTAFGLNDFYAKKLKGDLKWMDGTIASSPLLSKYWKKRFVDTFRIHLFGLGRVEQSLGPDRLFSEVYEEQLKAAEAPEKLIDNERRYYALAAIDYVDRQRLAILKSNREQTQGSTVHPFAWRLALAKWLMEGTNLEDQGAGLPDEAKYLWTSVIPDIQHVADQATKFWTRVIEFENTRNKRGEFESLGPVLALLGDIKNLKEMKTLEQDLLGVAKQLFYLPGGKVPAVATYKAMMKERVVALTGLATKYDTKLLELAREQARGKTVDQARFIELGWVQWFILYIAQYLKEFDPLPLPATPTAAEKREREDALVRHRLTLARWWYGVADQLKMEDLKTHLAAVYLGTLPTQKQSMLALWGEWKVDETGGLKLMQKEFPKGVIRGAEPLTGADIANFSYMLYAADLAEEIRKVLDVEGMAGDFSGTKGPVINQALERMKKKAYPKRYVMTDFIASIRPADRDTFADVVEKHPKYLDFSYGLDPSDAIFIPSQYSIHLGAGGIVVWTVPRISELISLFARELPALDALVRAQMEKNVATYEAALAAAKKGKKPKDLGADWVQWMVALQEVLKADPTQVADLTGTIVTAYGEAMKALERQARRATSHERHVILNTRLLKMWADYDPSDIATYSMSSDAVRLMLTFAAHVNPPRDAALQMAALLIELGPILYARLGPREVLAGLLETEGTTRYDLILGLLPHLVGTVAVAANSAKLAELKSLDLIVPLGFDTHLSFVKKLKEQVEKSTIEMQLSREMNVNKASQSISTPSWSYVLYAGPDNEFLVEGIYYQLVEVYETFTYVPGVVLAAGGIDWPESELGDSLLTYGDGTVARKADRKGKPLFKIIRNGEEKVVHDNDDRLLSEVMYAVMMQGFLESMEALGAALETLAEIMLTGMEFIPGIGAPIMAARIFTSIMAFVASPQFKQIREAFGGDAGEMAREAIKQVKTLFTAEIFWGWLLFGKPELPSLAPAGETPNQKKVRTRHGKSTAVARLGKLVARLAQVGVRLGERIGRMKDKFEYPMRRTKVFVITHPIIARVINLIVENFTRLASLARADLSLAPDVAEEMIKEEMTKLSGQVTQLLQTLEELQLPDEVIPLDQLVDLVITLAVDALPKKYELAAEGVKAGLETIGVWDDILDAITNQLKAANVDPNALWRELIKTELEPTFEALCGEFATAAGSTLREVPFLKSLGDPETPSVKVQSEPGEFPEVQESPSEHPTTAPTPLRSWPRTAGVPLDTPLHSDAARRFGHDFSHVRLHTGADARSVTQALGAEGLTTGSHVFLRPGLSPQSGHGADVFRHELSHVIQQTGPRPRTEPHSPEPVPGDRGRGVRHDGGLEAAADRSAAQARRSSVAARPLDPGSTGERAPQPKLDDVMKQFFTAVGADKTLLEHVTATTAGRGGPKGLRLNAYAQRVASELAGKFESALTALPATLYPGYLAPVYDQVAKYIVSNHGTEIRASMGTIVKRAHEGKAVKTKDSSGITKEKTEYSLNPSRLKQEFEEYVFGKTGVLLDIEFHLETPAAGAPENKQLKLSDPIASLKVEALHLAYLGGTAGLWDTVIENTWIKHYPVIVPPSRFKNTADFKNQAEAVAAYKLNARLVLRDAGPQPKVFVNNEFRFSNWFAKQVEDSIFTVAGGELDPKAVGPWADYKSPSKTAANFSSGSGHIHLAFGTYADRKKPGVQWGVARNAHHITQFLILEYLRNKKSDKPFRHPLKLYPGVGGTSLVSEIENPDDGTTIKVGTYEVGRGGMMPTILISEHTHEQGGVHVHGKGDDDVTGTGPSTPGFAVHKQFRDALGDYEPIVFDKSPTKLQSVARQTRGEAVPVHEQAIVGSKQVTSPDLQKAIYRAANKTYHWMRDDMKTKLREGLKVEEVRFYETMVRRQMQENGRADYAVADLPAGYVPVAADMDAIADAAEAHNKSIMEEPAKVGFQTATP